MNRKYYSFTVNLSFSDSGLLNFTRSPERLADGMLAALLADRRAELLRAVERRVKESLLHCAACRLVLDTSHGQSGVLPLVFFLAFDECPRTAEGMNRKKCGGESSEPDAGQSDWIERTCRELHDRQVYAASGVRAVLREYFSVSDVGLQVYMDGGEAEGEDGRVIGFPRPCLVPEECLPPPTDAVLRVPCCDGRRKEEQSRRAAAGTWRRKGSQEKQVSEDISSHEEKRKKKKKRKSMHDNGRLDEVRLVLKKYMRKE